MLTECRIKWADDGSELDVNICSSHSIQDNDEEIFFYGLSRQRLIKACEEHELIENEWYVVEVY